MAASVRVCCALRITVGGELFLFLNLRRFVKTVQRACLCTLVVFMLRSLTVRLLLVQLTVLVQGCHDQTPRENNMVLSLQYAVALCVACSLGPQISDCYKKTGLISLSLGLLAEFSSYALSGRYLH